MSHQIRSQYVVLTLVLFIFACGSGPTEVATETSNNAEENMQIETSTTGSIKIAELLTKADAYAGKIVQITGTCTKINIGIMGRNWIHLKDGSKDDYDFIVTSDVQVTEGSIVSMRGVVALNKDFGAGYKYEFILEEGELVQ